MQSIVEDRKNALVEKLSTQYSLNRISMEEYERLIKYSQDIETDKELQIFEKIIEEHNSPQRMSEHQPDRESKDSSPEQSFQNHFTLLSSRKTTGALTGGNFINILGDHKIIINEEDLINDKTVLNVVVLLGGMVIHVPENVNVIVKAFPLLADIKTSDDLCNKDSRKKLIIEGAVILGDIKIRGKK